MNVRSSATEGVVFMTCKDCVHLTECSSLAMSNFDHAHKMWMLDFWENAEQRCDGFKEKSVESEL